MSLSLADMDRYSAVTDMRFDWRAERVSCDDIVLWRVSGAGGIDDEDEVDARDRREGCCCSMVATDMATGRGTGRW